MMHAMFGLTLNLLQFVTITELDIEFVAILVEPVVRWKVFVNKAEELFADIRFNFRVVRGIEPGNVSFSWFFAV